MKTTQSCYGTLEIKTACPFNIQHLVLLVEYTATTTATAFTNTAQLAHSPGAQALHKESSHHVKFTRKLYSPIVLLKKLSFIFLNKLIP